MKALKIIGLIVALVFGTLLAVYYKELVGLSGSIGFVVATLGGLAAVLSVIIMLLGTLKALKNRMMIR